MTEDIRRWLDTAVDTEPPLTLDRDAVFSEGKRLVRRRRTVAAGGVAAGVMVLAAGVAVLTSVVQTDSTVTPAQTTVATSEDVAPPGPLLPLTTTP